MSTCHLERGKRFGRFACGLVVLVAASAALGWSAPKKQKAKPDKENLVTALRIVVTAGPQNRPIDNASVYVRYQQPRFLRHPAKIELDLKTDLAGVAVVTGVPRIDVIIQVVKPNWQPFGEHYLLDKAKQTIRIKLKPPANWY